MTCLPSSRIWARYCAPVRNPVGEVLRSCSVCEGIEPMVRAPGWHPTVHAVVRCGAVTRVGLQTVSQEWPRAHSGIVRQQGSHARQRRTTAGGRVAHGSSENNCYGSMHEPGTQTDTSRPNDRLFAGTRTVMSVNAGHRGFRLLHESKSWMPAFAGMSASVKLPSRHGASPCGRVS